MERCIVCKAHRYNTWGGTESISGFTCDTCQRLTGRNHTYPVDLHREIDRLREENQSLRQAILLMAQEDAKR